MCTWTWICNQFCQQLFGRLGLGDPHPNIPKYLPPTPAEVRLGGWVIVGFGFFGILEMRENRGCLMRCGVVVDDGCVDAWMDG